MKPSDSPLIVQGHRGCRGTYPENAIEGFLEATSLGVDYLELDVVCTGDLRIIVSHDPFMHHEICTTPEGHAITKEEEHLYNIYRMTTAIAQSFQLGIIPHPRFPQQKQLLSYKPLLSELVNIVREHAEKKQLKEPGYNIEIKSEPSLYGTFQPEPGEYVKLFLAELYSLGIEKNSTLQSFDINILQEIHRQAPDLKLVFLTENPEASPTANMEALGFKPYAYSPNFRFIDSALVTWCANEKMELIAWTINEVEDMKKLIELGVRNIITDYPEKAMKLK